MLGATIGPLPWHNLRGGYKMTAHTDHGCIMATDTSKLDRILADNQRERERGYRDKALKMYPHVCGRCAREFSGKRLSELTVHHRDHNHDNNPQDGSNWELLCLYCHDNEHARYTDQQYFTEGSLSTPSVAKATHNPFAALAGLMKKE